MKEENPFEDSQAARNWIMSVEDTSGQNYLREKEIYPLLEKTIAECKAKNILEIGAGQGICSIHLGENFDSYTGIEPSQVLVDRAKEKYKDAKRKFIIGDAYKIPFEQDLFDFVFSSMVLFHLADLQKATTELARVLKVDGHFLIITANPNAYEIWKSFFDNPIVDDEHIEGMIHIPAGIVSRSIIYKHTKEQILSAFNGAGLKITSVEEAGYLKDGENNGIFMLIQGIK